jgi:alanyl-tRNA synthetase
MGGAYPELVTAQAQVERVLKKEEQRFAETLQNGMDILEACVGKLQSQTIPGDVVFLLYDTYGFPVDLTADYARENHLEIDREGFEREMDAQRTRARAASGFGADYDQDIDVDVDGQTDFTGYTKSQDRAKIVGLFEKGKSVETLLPGEEAVVVLNKTPFYAESGGQVGDAGLLSDGENSFTVKDTQKQGSDLFLHKGTVTAGSLTVGQDIEARVDPIKRQATALNHSATHLLHAALRQVLGEHVTQKGSLVNSERLRFDFSHFEPVTSDELITVERIVNQQIRLNNAVSAEVMAKEDAMQAGAMALFGEKYGDQVRVLRIGDFSTELCGGIHVDRAGDIGFIKIISETGVAAGVRRIEAISGVAAVAWSEHRDQTLADIASQLKSSTELAADKVGQLIDRNKNLEKQLDQLKVKLASNAGEELDSQAIDVNGLKVLAAKLDNVDNKTLRNMVDQLKNKLGSSAIVLATVEGEKVS